MNAPRISVLVTTYNALDYLKLCVRSLLDTTAMQDKDANARPPQIVIYADGSREETRHYLESLQAPNLKWRYEPRNAGITVALNRAAALADGDYLYFVNDDMVFTPGWQGALLKHAAPRRVLTGAVIEPQQPGVGVAPCHIVHNFGLTHEEFDEAVFQREAPGLAEDRLEPGINYPFLIARELFAQIGGIDERFAGPVHDPDLFYRIALSGAEMLRARDSLCYHFSGRTLRFADGRARVSRAWIEQERDGKIAFLRKWGEKQHYSFGGVPHPQHTQPDQNWPPATRLKLALMERRYRRRAARQLAEAESSPAPKKSAQLAGDAAQ